MKLLVLNGPNLNLLGVREPEIYGKKTYFDLVDMIENYCTARGIGVHCTQSNHEGVLIDTIQEAYFDKVDGIVFNPAGFTHTSVALLDALKAVQIPTVEVHISAVSDREDFRRISYIRPYCLTTVEGMGLEGYLEAIDELIAYVRNQGKSR